ncbi:MAG TPA: histidine kinase, partial [Flavisolibacter sp.]|nr:histidine kinase [Flavisolibacter sp.]
GKQPSRFNSIVYGIEQYNDSLLLIGSGNNGLNFYNVHTNKYEALPLNLPSKTVIAVKKDKHNNILFTTDYGLYKLNLNKKKVHAYFIDPGIVNSAFTSDNFVPLKNGKWLTFTGTEIISFYPDSISNAIDNKSKVTITGFRVFDSSLYIDSFMVSKQPLRLNYNQNFFTVEFAALDFSNIQEIKYYYMLSGIDKDWVNAGAKNFASYTNLEPGNYVFSVKAEKGDNSLETTSFEIVISPPFWKTWWFKVMLLIAALLIVFSTLTKIIKTIKFEASLKHKIAETEMLALRAQMNPHFIFNCLNAIDNLIQTNEKEKATTYLARFAKLIRVVLDNSKNNLVPFYKEYEALNLFLQLEQFRCSNRFEYVLKADDEIINGDYKVPPFLVQPFIENAIHHGLMNKSGMDKKLSVEITLKNESINYIIKDNGIGREKALKIKNLNKPEHISYGIDISTERVQMFNKNGNGKGVVITDLITEGTPSGTVVEVSINVNNTI